MVYRTRQMTVCSGDATQNDVFPVSHLGNTPGALPAGLVQPCPKPRALIHKPLLIGVVCNEQTFISRSFGKNVSIH